MKLIIINCITLMDSEREPKVVNKIFYNYLYVKSFKLAFKKFLSAFLSESYYSQGLCRYPAWVPCSTRRRRCCKPL